MSILGTQTAEVAALDAKYLAKEDQFRKDAEKARREREARGEGSMYSQLQPYHRPRIEDLLNKRIDVLYPFDVNVDGTVEKHRRWCQGDVIEVCENRTKPTVKVRWDAMPDVEGSEVTETEQILLPSKWNKDCDGAWRMDVDIELNDKNDSGNSDDEDSDDSGSESESESSDGDGDSEG